MQVLLLTSVVFPNSVGIIYGGSTKSLGSLRFDDGNVNDGNVNTTNQRFDWLNEEK